jgi:hypothetical protein
MKKIIHIILIAFAVVVFSCKEEKNPLKRDKSFIPKGMSVPEYGMDKWMEQNARMTKDPKLGYVPYDRLAVAQAYTNSLINNPSLRTNALAWTEREPIMLVAEQEPYLLTKEIQQVILFCR